MRFGAAFALALVLAAPPTVAGEPKRVTLEVPSMNCSLCPLTIRKALARVPGVIEASADFETRRADVRYDPARVSPDALAKAVTDAGYPAKVRAP